MIFQHSAKPFAARVLSLALLLIASAKAGAQVSNAGPPLGILKNGGHTITGWIGPAYDVDKYTIFAAQGENILLRMTDLGGVGFDPQMTVYKPDGSLQAWDWGSASAAIDFTAALTGVYTVVAMDYNIGAATGPYDIYFTRL